MIGKKLKEYRQRLKLTGTTLAKLAGINQPYLSEIENEKKVPPMDTFMNLVNAIANNAPINTENYEYILTENNFDDFVNLLEISISFVDNDYIQNKYITHIRYQSIELYHSTTDEKPDENEIVNTDISEQFFDGWREDELFNLLPIDGHEDEFSVVYSIDEIRANLYLWWYETILSDFVHYLDDEEAPMILNSELDLILQIQSLRNGDGSFSPSDDTATNLSKELLSGKTVIFDMRSIDDKNVRALLDGQLLTEDEILALKFTLSGIRYNRQNNDKNSYFGRKRQKLIDEGYFDNKD